jgi:hypothetical protein
MEYIKRVLHFIHTMRQRGLTSLEEGGVPASGEWSGSPRPYPLPPPPLSRRPIVDPDERPGAPPQAPSLVRGKWRRPTIRGALGLLAAAAMLLPILFALFGSITGALCRRAVSQTDSVCLTPYHVLGLNLSSISFANETFYQPRLVNGPTHHRTVLSTETNTLCPHDPPVRVLRRVSIIIKDSPPFRPWRRTSELHGEKAVCVQHMLEMFEKGRPKCGK